MRQSRQRKLNGSRAAALQKVHGQSVLSDDPGSATAQMHRLVSVRACCEGLLCPTRFWRRGVAGRRRSWRGDRRLGAALAALRPPAALRDRLCGRRARAECAAGRRPAGAPARRAPTRRAASRSACVRSFCRVSLCLRAVSLRLFACGHSSQRLAPCCAWRRRRSPSPAAWPWTRDSPPRPGHDLEWTCWNPFVPYPAGNACQGAVRGCGQRRQPRGAAGGAGPGARARRARAARRAAGHAAGGPDLVRDGAGGVRAFRPSESPPRAGRRARPCWLTLTAQQAWLSRAGVSSCCGCPASF